MRSPNARTYRWVSLAIATVVLAGCGQKLDSDPVIFGVTPQHRAQMREVISETDSSADADQVVQDYMAGLRKIAEGIDAKPDAAGNIALTAEMQELVEQMTPDLHADKLALKMPGEDFALELPSWADPLVKEYEANSISVDRKELLRQIIYVEWIRGLAG